MEDLTVENFIAKIKLMPLRTRNKLDVKVLTSFIIQLPDNTVNLHTVSDLQKTVNEVMTTLTQVQNVSLNNTQEINKINLENIRLNMINAELSKECRRLSEVTDNHRNQLDSIETYLRVNNLEISGLTASTDELISVEDDILQCLNGLNPEEMLTSQDIDICHELPKKDGSKNHVVRFVRRKSKNMILAAKKKPENKHYKYSESNIFVNEHLTPTKKYWFSIAKQKKLELKYKYLWTRNGKILIRKDDDTEVITIDSEDVINNL